MKGIYKLTNLINGKIYIGQSTDLERRRKKFFSFSTWHYAGEAINNARKKYNDEEYWNYEILEIVDDESLLNEKEIFYIEQYHTNAKEFGYNLTNGGDGIEAYQHTDEAKEKIRQYMLINCPWRGKKRSDEHIEKLKKSLKGRDNIWNKGKHWDEDFKVKDSERMKKLWKDEEYRKRQIESHAGKPNIHSMKQIDIFDDNGNYIKTVESVKECQEFFNVSKATFYRRLKKNKLPIKYK